MNNLLLYFAFPVATIILSIVGQKLIKCPILVALSFFSIYLVASFSVFPQTFLIYAIVYTILSYFTAVIYRFVARLSNCENNFNNCTGANNQFNINNDSSCGCNMGNCLDRSFLNIRNNCNYRNK